jgi:hypothetical protein
MAIKILRASIVIGLGLAALALSAGQNNPAASKKPADNPAKPLVRKDLLVFGKGEIAPPVRDIFRPRAFGGPAVAPAYRPAAKAAPAVAPAETAPTFALTISYIGSVKSGGQTLALILRGGQTESVREGDEIIPGYRVISLTAEALVVQGPTGETRTFQKQGDRP